jgi:DNA polymerase elongation subunit (family B)
MSDKLKEIQKLEKQASEIKKEVDYYNALQLALKLVLNGSYGAFAAPYFILYNNHVAGTITAEGRELTKKMDKDNEEYWYKQWHLDFELHKKLSIDNVTSIDKKEPVSIYGDTDSIFVSFKPCMDHCNWKDRVFNSEYLNSVSKPFIVLSKNKLEIDNPNLVSKVISEGNTDEDISNFKESLKEDFDLILIDGFYSNNKEIIELLKDRNYGEDLHWNWCNEVDFINGIDQIRFADFFKQMLDEHANSYGVENKEDFELERISESIINIAKKKYIQHILFEDGIPYTRMDYIFPKGVELVRSSTPAFARDKIVNIVKYLFSNPDTFNIKELLKLVKSLRKEFELADIDDISMQSSVNKYDEKVLNDETLPLSFVSGAHFAVKSAAYYNHLLKENKPLQDKYEFIKSGTKIKYYVCKDKKVTDMFAYMRGSYPVEFAPEIDYDTQFAKSILSPINSIIEPLGMPTITKRLSVVMDIFAGFGNTQPSQSEDDDLGDIHDDSDDFPW